VTVTFNWQTVTALVAALAGVAGTIITPIWGTQLASEIQGILQGLSALLIAIPAFHATSIVASTTIYRAKAKVDVERETELFHLRQQALPPAA